jgi:hypothetical protein
MKYFLLLMVFLTVSAARADPAQDDERQLIADVNAAGVLFGFAENCRVSKPDLTALMKKQVAHVREVVAAKVPNYAPADFKQDFQSGYDMAAGLASALKPGTKQYTKNCTDIRAKVSAKLLEK